MRPPEEIIECRECGRKFDLAAQNYYDNLCPACVRESDPDRTWPMCWECSERVPPDERATVRLPPAARDPGPVPVTVHEGRCKAKLVSRRRAEP